MIWAVSLSTTELIPRSLTATLSLTGIRSLANVSNLVGPIGYPVALPPARNLSFQPKWVRSSTQSYLRFNLAMGRSLRFGSRPGDSFALFGLAFATASPHGLTSPPSTNSQAHSSKGTPSPHKEAPTDCRQSVSGTISLPSRGTFHLSLTVLVRYRSPGNI